MPEYTGETTNAEPTIYKWSPEAKSDTGDINLYLLTKALDFGNHAQRKVIQSISFTYKSTDTFLCPYIYATYLNGDPPVTYYMCTSAAGTIGNAELVANDYQGILPSTDTSATLPLWETFQYKHVLDNGVTGNPASMRSKLKNVGSIQIGLVRLAKGETTASDFTLEEISITYRMKNPK